MYIDTSRLKGKYVYLEPLSLHHRDIIHSLAKNEIIWEFNKMLPVDDGYDTAFDKYFNTALDDHALGGQKTFVIKRTEDNMVIGTTRLYEINPKEKNCTDRLHMVHSFGLG